MAKPPSANKLNTIRPQPSQNDKPSQCIPAEASRHSTNTETERRLSSASAASDQSSDRLDKRSEEHEMSDEEPVSPSTVTQKQQKLRIFSTANQTIAHYQSTTRNTDFVDGGPSMPRIVTVSSQAGRARQDPDWSRQPQDPGVPAQTSSMLKSSGELGTRPQSLQRRCAVDFGRRHGPLATVQDNDTGVDEGGDAEEEDNRPCEELARFCNPFR